MKTVVVVQDHAGYSERVRAIRSAGQIVYPVAPSDFKYGHTQSFTPPSEWLPQDESRLFRWKCWWKADAMALAAVQELEIDADFYWFIESDCVASQERWRTMFAEYEDNTVDCLSTYMGSRPPSSDVWHWNHPGTPRIADRFFIMAIYRLSRRAVEESIRRAEELRECFSEIAVPFVVRQAGFTFGQISSKHSNFSTMKTIPSMVRMDVSRICHPVKSNTFGP